MIPSIIIDDEKAVEKLIRFFIKEHHLPLEIVGTAFDGKSGEELLKSKTPLLVFIDIQMPFKSGLELMESYPWHKYIVITAFDFFSYARKSLQLGASDYLLKPIGYEEFKSAIERTLELPVFEDPITSSVINIIHLRYKEKLTLESIASELGYNSSYLSRQYKKHTGKTIMNSLTRKRMSVSRQLLEKSDLNIKEIAENIGYESSAGFYRDFRKYFEMTPNKYRSECIRSRNDIKE